MSIVTYKRGDKALLTKNFCRYEFECSCGCSTQTVDTELPEKLQCCRDLIGEPIKITSGYRCSKHNRDVGGSTNSQHRYGRAADWRLTNRSLNPVAMGIIAQAVGFRGVGIYWYGNNAFVHTDTRSKKATWLCTSSGKYAYTTSSTFILPTIKKGCTGTVNQAATQMLQRLLGISVDGVFGSNTEAALKKAQNSHGITADGVCGPTSWKTLSGANRYL